MPGSRTVRFIISADASNYQQVLRSVEQSGGRLAQAEQRVGSSVRRTTEDLHHHGAAGREAFLVVGSAMDATGAKVGPLATAFYRIDMIFDSMDRKSGKIQRLFTGIGVAGMAAGGLILAASAKEQSAVADLQGAVENSGKSWADYRHELEATAAAQKHFGTSKTEALTALATLTRASRDPAQAMKDLALAEDLHAAKHIPLQQAAEAIAAAYGGSTKLLKGLGIAVKDLVNPEQELTKAQHDQAAAAAAMSTAQQHLSDIRARVAQAEADAQEKYRAKLQSARDAEQQANQRVADSTARVADARRNLRDVEQQVHEATQLTIDDAYQLLGAQNSLADVNNRIAAGELTGQDALIARRDAQLRLKQVEADQNEKQKVSLGQQRQLRDAHESVTKAVTAETRARDAQSKAHEKTVAVQRAGVAQISLSLRQEEAAAERSYRKAQQRVAAANREMAKAKADMAAFPSRTQQVLDEVNERVGGAAEKQADTWLGRVKAALATAENAFAGFGTSTGAAVTAVSTGITATSALVDTGVGRMIGRALRKIGLLSPAMAAADASIVAEATATGVASSVALGPIVLAVAAIGIAAYLLWRNWDKVWGWITHHKGYAALIAMLVPITVPLVALVGTIHWVYRHWDAVWGKIQKITETVAAAMKEVWKDLIWFYNQTIGNIPGLGGKIELPVEVLKPTNKQATALGAWQAGGGANLGALAKTSSVVSKPRPSPRFATGTSRVPGPVGAPLAAIVHGGERIAPVWESGTPRGGDGVSIGELHVHVDLSHSAITDPRTAQRFADMIGDGVHSYLLRKKRGGNPELGLA